MKNRPPYYALLRIFFLLLAGLPILFLGQSAYKYYLTQNIGKFQNQNAQDALSFVSSDFENLQKALHLQVLGLKRRLYENAPQNAIDHLQIPQNAGIEWYAANHDLLGWRGFYTPLDSLSAFPKANQSQMLNQGDIEVLETWMRVEKQDKTIAFIRVLQLLRSDAPFENADNLGFSLAEEWQKKTNLPIQINWQQKNIAAFEQSDTVILKDFYGKALGSAKAVIPTDLNLLATFNQKWANIYAFWFTLIWLWLLFSIWQENDRQLVLFKSRKGKWYTLLGIFLGFTTLLFGGRFLLLTVDLPRKWFVESSNWYKLFDPTILATEYGFGSARSVGDFVLTGIFCMLFALFSAHIIFRIFHRFSTIKVVLRQQFRAWEERLSPLLLYSIWSAFLVLCFALLLCFPLVLDQAIFHLVNDSVLNYFEWTGLSPSTLIAAVYIGMYLLSGACVMLSGMLLWVCYLCLSEWRMMRSTLHYIAIFLLLFLTWWIFFYPHLSLTTALYYLILLIGVAYSIEQRAYNKYFFFSVRGLLFLITALTLLLYPLLYKGIELQKSARMEALAELYSVNPTEGTLFTLNRFNADMRLNPYLMQNKTLVQQEANALLHQLAIELSTSQSGGYEVSLSQIDPNGKVLQHFVKSSAITDRSVLADLNGIQSQTALQNFTQKQKNSWISQEKSNPIYHSINANADSYLLLRAMPQKYAMRDVIPQYDDWQSQFSATVFENGKRIRSVGEAFEKVRLPFALHQQIKNQKKLLIDEKIYDIEYETLYQLIGSHIVAIRSRSIQTSDHLYQMMRMYWAGLILALPFYVLGLYLRKKAGLLPLPQSNFRDKVLDAFLGVGVLTAFVMGFVANSAIGYTNQGSLRGNLQNRLERMEAKLITATNDAPATILEKLLKRNQLDSLSNQIGLDLHVYQRASLFRTTRPDLVKDRLIASRLPLDAYQRIFYHAERQVFVSDQPNERVLPYTVGYAALSDEKGNPKFVLSALAIAEEDRIREESARTSAYLFTALLLLLLAVLGTATTLAAFLTRPLRRLRIGLEQVAEGNFEKDLPVESHDEIGDLVRTFNMMQHQLSFSQKQLAEQQKRLAWNEMARQVAHEIKNPLTPMKLSVQHLQRAYKDAQNNPVASDEKMRKMFGRVTQTLIEQIETLNNIANEFSNFARLPENIPQPNNLNEIIDEAYRLQEAYDAIEIIPAFYPEELTVLVDRENMRRIFINLIKNGAQAMQEGGCVVLKTEKMETEGKAFAVAYVTDNGSGIPPEIRDKVFQPNFSTKTSGMGLGLAIVKKTIEEAGGLIDFETEEGLGTTFRIILPLQNPEEKMEINTQNDVSSGNRTPKNEGN